MPLSFLAKSGRKSTPKGRRGKGARGRPKRGSIVNDSIDEEQNGVANNNADSDVPELEDPDPPSVAPNVTTRRKNSLRLNANADSSVSSIDLNEEEPGENEKRGGNTDDDVTEILNEFDNDKSNIEEVSKKFKIFNVF